jgi:hypothetical protein
MSSSVTIPERSAAVTAYLVDFQNTRPPTPSRRGRLIFALDATASRQPTWDTACAIQGEMFEAAAGLGPLEVKLAFYRGFDECKTSRWLFSAPDLHQTMRHVTCVGGHTQIERILNLGIRQAQAAKLGALIFVGDACEEKHDPLCHLAGGLGKRGVPVFVFHEGNDNNAGRVFRQIAQLSGGAYLPFSLAGIAQLKTLLGAVAVFVSGGRRALEDYAEEKGGAVLQLSHQLKKESFR